MKYPWSNLIGIPKALVVCIAVLLVSSGLCGMQWAIASALKGDGGAIGGLFMLTGIVELFVMVVSACGIVLLLIVWPIHMIYSKYAKPKEIDLNTLFDNSDENKNDDSRKNL